MEKRGWPLSFLFLQSGKGYAYEGKEGGADDNGRSVKGEKVDVELADIRKLGIVTLGAMKQYERIEKFLNFLKSVSVIFLRMQHGLCRQQPHSHI